MPWKPTRRAEANKRQSHTKTTTERGYGWKHQQFRERMIRERPLCERCIKTGVVTPATDLHHKRKIKDRPDLAFDELNIEMICQSCHDKATAKGE